MKVPKVTRVLTIVSCVLVLYLPATAQHLTLTGQILTTTIAKGQVRRFNIKLYPPKSSGKALQVTTSDAYGRFKFAGLSASSYLLEVYLGKDLVYQEVIKVTGNTDRKIDLRKKKA